MKYLILILFLIPLRCMAPAHPEATIIAGEVIRPYEALIKAIVSIESSGNNYAYNAKEGAYGAFQIRQVRLNDFNKKTGKDYKLVDMYDYNKSEEVFLYYCQGDYEYIAKSWNGSGPMTINYWRNVQNVWLNAK